MSDKANYNKNQHFSKVYEDDDVKLHFVGDLKPDNYYELKDHINPGYEICIIGDGKGFFKVKDTIYNAEENTVFITEPLQQHSGWSSSENPYRILYLCFSLKKNEYEEKNEWNKISKELNRFKTHVSYDRYRLKEIHKRLLDEVKNNYEYRDEVVSNILKELIYVTIRDFKQYDEEDIQEIKSEESIISNHIIRYIQEHINEKVTLKDLSDSLNYSSQHLCRSFISQTGFTIMQFYNYIRLEKAKDLIKNGTMSFTQISESLHFNNIHHFSSSFKKIYGYTPTEYKKNHVNLI